MPREHNAVKYSPLHLLVLLAVVGCRSSAIIASKQDLHMDSAGQKREQLTIGQTTLSIVADQTVSNGNVTINISADGEPVESERYVVTDSDLQLQTGSDATFEPPLPILKIPSGAGQNWTWSGTMEEGQRKRQASATVSTSSKGLELNGAEQPCIVSQVRLSIDNGTPVPAQRVLTFWFSKNGLVKREFGMGTTRTDADPGANPGEGGSGGSPNSPSPRK